MESLFQTEAWAKFKQKTGWSFERVGGWYCLSRAIGYGQRLNYYPEIPYDPAVLDQALAHLPQNGAMINRFEFLERYDAAKAESLKQKGLIKSFEDVQPEYRQWVSLAGDEAGLRVQMKPKGRYNLGIAERSGLDVVVGGRELVSSFYQLYSYTAGRTHFSGRGEEYFKKLVDMLVETGYGEVLLIKKGGDLLSGGIFSYYGELGSYLYGGSMGDRSVMAPYLMHWTAMQRAKARGCQIYDLLAVAPPGEENHPYTGLTRFKSQFGGETVQLLGSWDLVQKPFWYKLYTLAEKYRRKKSIH